MTNFTDYIVATLITLNNFFVHFIKKVVILRYRYDMRFLPINNIVEIYNLKSPKNSSKHAAVQQKSGSAGKQQ